VEKQRVCQQDIRRAVQPEPASQDLRHDLTANGDEQEHRGDSYPEPDEVARLVRKGAVGRRMRKGVEGSGWSSHGAVVSAPFFSFWLTRRGGGHARSGGQATYGQSVLADKERAGGLQLRPAGRGRA